MSIMEILDLKTQLENLCFRYWESMPEPKPQYTQWWYGDGGPMEALQTIFERILRESGLE